MADTIYSKQGVVLSSGSANGAYAVGAMEALFAGKSPSTGFRPLDPQVFSGSSIGSFSSSFLVSRMEETDGVSAAADLKRVWTEDIAQDLSRGHSGAFKIRGDLFRLFDPRYIAANPVQPLVELIEDSSVLAREGLQSLYKFARSDLPLPHRILNLVDLGNFISIEPYLEIIKETIQFDNIVRASRTLKITATNWSEGTLETFSNQDLTDELGPYIIQGSSAMPGLFPHVHIDNQAFADAAVLGYAKLAPAIDAGAFNLHLIYPDPPLSAFPEKMFWSTLDAIYRIFIAIWTDRLHEYIDTMHQIDHFKDELDGLIAAGDLSREKAQRLFDTILPTDSFQGLIRHEALDQRLAVHRYFPHREHAMGIMNFDRPRIEDLIRIGYEDTIHHDCEANGCVLPEGLEATFPQEE